MICESVISDRLVSYFVRQCEAGGTISNGNVRSMLDGASNGEDEKHISTSHLVRSLETVFDDLGEKKFERLPERLRKWMDDRNRAAHAFVKTHPFTKSFKEPLDEFIERLDTCAKTGTGLARTLDAWTRRKGVIARTPPTP